jgi:hypothetical protein
MRGCRASVVEHSPGVRPLLEPLQTRKKQYKGKRNFPDAKDGSKINGIAKMGEYNSNIFDAHEAPDCSSRHFKCDDEGACPVGDPPNAWQ